MISEKQILKLVNEQIKDTDVFVVKLEISPANDIRVSLDSDSSISISKCIEISRKIEGSLDRDAEDFSLMVSSYGLTEPLIMDRQIKKYIGRNIIIKTLDNEKIKGKLLQFDPEQLALELNLTKKQLKEGVQKEISVKRSEIKDIKIEISFK